MTERELIESDSTSGILSDWRAGGLSIGHLEDIAEDTSAKKLVRNERYRKFDETAFCLHQLAALPVSSRLAYVQVNAVALERLKQRDLDSVGTLLCEAASDELAVSAPIVPVLR